MADNDQPLPEKIADALNTFEEFTGVNVKKATAKTARHAYVAQVAAITLTVPFAVGGPSAISQEQTRRKTYQLRIEGTQSLCGAYWWLPALAGRQCR